MIPYLADAKNSGSPGIAVILGKIRECWAGLAHPTSLIYSLTMAIPKEIKLG
jgi:hypothetical protein